MIDFYYNHNPSKPLHEVISPQASLISLAVIFSGVGLGVLFFAFPLTMVSLTLSLSSVAIAVAVCSYCKSNMLDGLKDEKPSNFKPFFFNFSLGAVTGLSFGAACGAFLGTFIFPGFGTFIGMAIGAGAGAAMGCLAAAVGTKMGFIVHKFQASKLKIEAKEEPPAVACNVHIPSTQSKSEPAVLLTEKRTQLECLETSGQFSPINPLSIPVIDEQPSCTFL